MAFNILTRKVHYWAGVAAALPLFVVVASGVLLQTKKHWAWVQPVEQHGTGTTPAIGFEEILASLQAVPEMHVVGWNDVNRPSHSRTSSSFTRTTTVSPLVSERRAQRPGIGDI